MGCLAICSFVACNREQGFEKTSVASLPAIKKKPLLESGHSAFIEMGAARGWIKISLVKTDFDVGIVNVYISKDKDFKSEMKPFLALRDQLDPCVIDIKEFGVCVLLSGGTAKASYIELIAGTGAEIREIR